MSIQAWLDRYLPLITDAEASACAEAEIAAFEKKWRLNFREDHKCFLKRFGGNVARQSMPKFLQTTNSYYDLAAMEGSYEDYLNFPDEVHIPSGWQLFAQHDVDCNIAINQSTGELYTYDGDIIYDFYADSVDKFLAQHLYFYINFNAPVNKNKIIGFSGNRPPNTDEQVKAFLRQHGFEVFEELCDVKKIAAQRGDAYFFSDFETLNFSRVLSRNFGFFAFSAPEAEANKMESMANALATMLSLTRQIQT
ncbi:MAG: hypothetical protein RLY58_1329 [Pseudomonadota bacterium]|jgi:hypothetical protein